MLMFKEIRKIIIQQPNKFLDYCRDNFIRHVGVIDLIENNVLEPIEQQITLGQVTITNVCQDKVNHFFITKELKWDSEYFSYPCYNLEMIITENENVYSASKAIATYLDNFKFKKSYITLNIPSSQTFLLQAVSLTVFRLVETRLNYFLKIDPIHADTTRRIREATQKDIIHIMDVARRMRNDFDRVHADYSISQDIADNYIATFAEQSIKGFADLVLVPDIVGKPPFGFLAGNYPLEISGIKVSRLVLAAVDSSVQKGWLNSLLVEMNNRLLEAGANYLTTITQAANKPAIRVWEKAGFRLSNITHLFSYKKND